MSTPRRETLWSPQYWDQMDTAVRQQADRVRVAHKVVNGKIISNTEAIRGEILLRPGAAAPGVALPAVPVVFGRPAPAAGRAGPLSTDESTSWPVVELWVEFTLRKAEVDGEQEMHRGLNLAVDAARQLALGEDRIIFQGDNALPSLAAYDVSYRYPHPHMPGLLALDPDLGGRGAVRRGIANSAALFAAGAGGAPAPAAPAPAAPAPAAPAPAAPAPAAPAPVAPAPAAPAPAAPAPAAPAPVAPAPAAPAPAAPAPVAPAPAAPGPAGPPASEAIFAAFAAALADLNGRGQPKPHGFIVHTDVMSLAHSPTPGSLVTPEARISRMLDRGFHSSEGMDRNLNTAHGLLVSLTDTPIIHYAMPPTVELTQVDFDEIYHFRVVERFQTVVRDVRAYRTVVFDLL